MVEAGEAGAEQAGNPDSLADVLDRWQCTGCGWALNAPMADRERSMQLILQHEYDGAGAHPVVKVGDKAGPGRGRWARKR